MIIKPSKIKTLCILPKFNKLQQLNSNFMFNVYVVQIWNQKGIPFYQKSSQLHHFLPLVMPWGSNKMALVHRKCYNTHKIIHNHKINL